MSRKIPGIFSKNTPVLMPHSRCFVRLRVLQHDSPFQKYFIRLRGISAMQRATFFIFTSEAAEAEADGGDGLSMKYPGPG
jgi:hypothetical protein